jgi:flagellar basal body-associated protein FliL
MLVMLIVVMIIIVMILIVMILIMIVFVVAMAVSGKTIVATQPAQRNRERGALPDPAESATAAASLAVRILESSVGDS